MMLMMMSVTVKWLAKMTCFKAVKTASPWLIAEYSRYIYCIPKLNIWKFRLFLFCKNAFYLSREIIIIVSWKIFVVLNACWTHIQIMIMRSADIEYEQRRVNFCVWNSYERERHDSMHATERYSYSMTLRIAFPVQLWPVAALKQSITSVCGTHYARMRWYGCQLAFTSDSRV